MIIKKFEKQVERFAGKPAVVSEGKTLTYRDLNNYANRVAYEILEHDKISVGKEKKQIAALLFEHSADMIVGVIGTLKAGKVYVPLDINYPENRLIYMLKHSGAYLVLTNNNNLSLAEKLTAGENLTVLNIDTIDMDSNAAAADPQRDASGDKPAYILYTSGSTGKPKGVVQNHENVCYYIRNWTDRFSISSSDRMTLFSAFSHDGAGQDMFGALHNGGTLYPYNILKRTNIAELAKWLIEEKITIWHSVPTLYRYFLNTLNAGENLQFPDLRFILLGGEQIRDHDIDMFKRFFPGSVFANVYGQTESSVDTIWLIHPDDPIDRMLIGEPLDNTKVLIVTDDGEIVEDLGVGEIYISCPHLALGYWEDEENTGKVFFNDPDLGRLYRTGDLGRLMADGNVEIMGRKDSQVKIRGFRVETGEIETRLLSHEGIKEAVVAVKMDESQNPHLCAYIVPDPLVMKSGKDVGSTFTVSELREHLAGDLPEYMIPSYYIELEKMPLTPNGKVDRKKLPDPEPVRPVLGVTYVAPQTGMEKKISGIWKEVLKLDTVGIKDNFFDLGGTSFDILQIMSKLHEVFKKDIPVVSIFRYPTIHSFSEYLKGEEELPSPGVKTRMKTGPGKEPGQLAVIGMAGRFPGSKNIGRYWENLKNGVESITFFTAEQLENWRIDRSLLEDPNYVKANALLEDADYFDAAFFNYSPGEARMMDPQLRIMHECSWEALENAGYDPDSYNGLIGLYAGNSPNHYWVTLAYLNRTNNIDALFLNNNYSTKVSYKLNLQGPSFVVQTACSTSLVAIHLACRGLLDRECDIALAGGVSVSLPDKSGYLFQEGMILSPDGHCRTFDAGAGGSIFGSGAGMVVLKRLEEALSDGDTVNAVIKATAINNDGKRKVGLTAPSVDGQAEVIRTALDLAGVEPETIGYVEAHGTATILGDPVEVEALKLAFNTDKRRYCGIGSVKTNIGHLNSAAGAAGFIKAVLALKHKQIPPTLNFETPNPKIDFENSPFYINTELREWEKGEYPLRAGVSSFGLGGTNAHAILEEAPAEVEVGSGSVSQWVSEHHLILLSAKTRTALEKMTGNFAEYLKKNPGIDLSNAAYTLQVGRQAFRHRRMLVGSDAEELIQRLSGKVEENRSLYTAAVDEENRPMVFMFPGLGSQYVNMGLELYRKVPEFRSRMDRCFDILENLWDYDLKEVIFPPDGSTGAHELLNRPDISQAAVFILEYALFGVLMQWGIKPHAMIGYSFGEYTAACLSGVFSLEDALELIAARGKLIMKMPPGKMLSVPLSKGELLPLMEAFNSEISIAIDNGASCIAAGSEEMIDEFEKEMKTKRYLCVPLQTTRAVHSNLLAPIVDEFKEKVSAVKLNKPAVPYISNVTGTWITVEEALDPGYWARHMVECVRFSDGITELKKEANALFLEVGPGRNLCSLILRHIEDNPRQKALNLLRPPEKETSDLDYLMNRLGQLWLNNVKIDWEGFYAGEKRRRIPLPTYPFEGERFWLEGNPLEIREDKGFVKQASEGKRPDTAEWFYVPSWESSPGPEAGVAGAGEKFNWLLFTDKCGIGTRLIKRLQQGGHDVVIVRAGKEFARCGSNEYTIDPLRRDDYNQLIGDCSAQGKIPRRILHLWCVTGKDRDVDVVWGQELGFYSLLHLAATIGKHNINEKIQITVLSDFMQSVTGEDLLYPQKAPVIGAVRVIPREYPHAACRSIDIVTSEPGSPGEEEQIDLLFAEVLSDVTDTVIAFRDSRRWVRSFKPKRLEKPVKKISLLKEQGVYLITGGLGGIGLVLSEYLTKTLKARLILTGRRSLSEREEWERQKFRDLERSGAEVLFSSVDVTDKERMKEVITRGEKRFGKINGVIHAAGVADAAVIQRRNREISERVLGPKVTGTLVLEEVLKDAELDFFILCSSVASVTALGGQVAYCAANVFLDHFAWYKSARNNTGTLTVSINWDTWQQVGMAVKTVRRQESLEGNLLKDGILPGEGIDIFKRILGGVRTPQVLVSTIDLYDRIKQVEIKTEEFRKKQLQQMYRSLPKHSRPELSTAYTAPEIEAERILAEIWQDLLGFEKVGIDDDFFELGGDSLKGITFAGRIHKELNVEVPLAEFFSRPTIKQLAAYIEENSEINEFSSVEPVEEKEYYQLSSAQKRLYILHRLDPENTGYNLTSAVIFEGDVNREQLEKIFGKLIDRHEILRTSFKMIKGTPVQRIHKAVEFNIEYYEGHHFVRPFIRPFDLSRALLLRVGLIKIAEAKHIFIVDVHHIMYDGTSIQLFFRELMDLYRGKELPARRIRYKDYSEWHNRRRDTVVRKRQEEYWLEVFSGDIPVIDLPFDYARPAVQSFEGNCLRFAVEEGDVDSLRAAAKEKEATLYMVLLGIINVLLMKVSGQEDIVVGTPVAARRHTDLEQVLGMFVNTLALRNRPVGEKTFGEFLEHLKENTFNAFENQEYQFEDLVEKVDAKRDVGRNPLFDVMFIFLNYLEPVEGIEEIEIEGLKLKTYKYDPGTSVFDLNFTTLESGNKLFFTVKYCTKLFKKETIERFIGYFMTLAASIRDNLEKKLSDIDIISGEEKNQLLYTFNNTETEYPKDKTIHDLFAEQAEKNPDRIAAVGKVQGGGAPFIASGSRNIFVTYSQLNEKSHQLAMALQQKGVQSDTIVGILVERSVEMLVGILGILKAGGAYLPMDPVYPEGRIDYMLEDSKTKIVLSEKTIVSKVIESLEVIDLGKGEPLYSSKVFIHHSSFVGHQSGNLAYVTYTSGSTGKPKGVMIEHRSVINFIKGITDIIPFGESDRILCLTTITFDIFGLETLVPLTAGSKVVVVNREEQLSTASAVHEIEREGITIFQLTPSRLQLLMVDPGSSIIFKSLGYLLVGGEAFPEPLLEKVRSLFHGKIYNLYGPTETTIWSAVKDVSGGKALNIGKPIANTFIYIVDKSGGLQPIGVSGELCIGGDGLSRGYLNRPELTNEKFRVTKYSHMSPMSDIYMTGDLARWLPDGNIEFLGRIDHQVKIRGFRVELEEIENHLQTHDNIKEAVVIPKEPQSGNKYLCAYVVLLPVSPSKLLNVTQLREFLSQRLPDYMIPSYFVPLEKIPLTPNGKVDRKALPDGRGHRMETGTTYVAPGTETEKIIAQHWQQVLQCEEKVGVEDNFFDLGGNSFKLIQLNTGLNEAFKTNIPVMVMLRYPTISSLVRYLDRGEFNVMVDRSDKKKQGKSRLGKIRNRKKEVVANEARN